LSATEQTTAKSAGRPRDERASQAIVDAALRQFVQVGYARMSMESVASEAKVARTTVYRRYQDKADLVTAAIAQSMAAVVPSITSADPRADLVRFLQEFDQRFGEHCVEILGTLLGARQDPRLMSLHRERVITPRMEYARGLLERAKAMGAIAVDADIELALEMLTGSVFARQVTGTASSVDWADRAVAIAWRGLSVH
jgi:AcrR family transcriptional regulator